MSALDLDDTELYRIPDVEKRLKLGRSLIYEQIRAGRLSSVTQGHARLFTAHGIRQYIALLEREAQEAA
jgi:hypothetical protein